MYHDLKQIYWWDGMKKDIADYVAKCPNCQQVKAEYLKPGGLTQIIEVPTWKWEAINMDFVVGLPRTLSLPIKYLNLLAKIKADLPYLYKVFAPKARLSA